MRNPKDTLPHTLKAPFLGRILSWYPPHVLLLALLPGFTLVVGSILLGIHDLTVPAKTPFVAPPLVERQVGYLTALNWSLTYSLLFPVSVYLMTEALQGIADALDRLYDQAMVRDSNMRPVRDRRWTASWLQGTPSRSRLIVVFAVLLPALLSIGEWFFNNLLRLLGRGLIASYPDYDWGLAGIIQDWPVTRRLLNAGFDLLAFSCQALLLGSSFAFFLYLLDLGRVLPHHGHGTSLTLLPNLRSEDSRRGFEEFAEPLQHMLIVALLSYLMCYLVRIEGLYLASKGSATLVAFVATDIIGGVKYAIQDPHNDGSVLAALFDAGSGSRQTFLAWTASLLVFTLCLVIVVITVRSAARLARSNALLYYEQPSATNLFGGSPAEEREWLRTMTVWPLGYIRLDRLLLAAVLAVAALYFYRIGLFIFGLILGALVLRLTYSVLHLAKDD